MMVSLSRQTNATIEEPAPMHVSRSVSSQQQRVQRYADTSDAFCFFNQLTSPELFDALEALLPDHRERLFPPDGDTVHVCSPGTEAGSFLPGHRQ